MNRFPLWKYILIAVVLVVSVLYTLPNFYGEVPAVQVSPTRSAIKADATLMQQVEDELKAQKIPYTGAFLDANSVKVRFASNDAQLKAKDALQARFGDGYSVALNLLSASPAWLTAIGAKPMYLGLDLRGGVYFLMQVDMPAALDKAADRYNNDLRIQLREQKIRYNGISRVGQTVEMKFSDAASRAQASKYISANFADLALTEQDGGGDYKLIAALRPEAQKRTQDFAVQQNITTLRNRVNELGVAEPIIQQQGLDRVVVQLPGVQDTAKAKEILGRTATLEIRLVDEEHDVTAALQGQIPFGDDLYIERSGQPLLVKKNVVLTGDYITDASPGFDQQSGQAAVHVNLDSRGARIFKDVTRDNVGKRMAILLIEKGKAEVITAPVIREEIGGGRVQITGMESAQEASDDALLLRAGALAAPMNIVEERTVGPSLGADNIKKGFHSNLWGFAAVALFMMIYYRVFGVFSTVALAVNGLFLVALLSMMQATLTLPGLAGIALTLGMAIDANVLINERIREELRNGNSPQAAIHAGYDRAWGTILDSNITTLIAGVALFWLGSGPVRGFAVVLCLGILTSMFSAVTVSRAMVNLSYGRKVRLAKVSI
ncbi:protein-export membrane protein SecD [Sulfuriferula multivorans]|uniref:Protein translocase subunit SecD n=1 Tax=Sulfuriferula multivorans TaxID=1559896 RepID=A0A401JGV8_9PROT|nr:protein translocase subunit SecD [Sulfuriferula multivorans]GBL46856.1 protein-export membrane protein SecD [Sulfuriferula multivorans]